MIIQCDRCGMVISNDGLEMQERFAVRFRAGYGSAFGDGNVVEGDFCQKCIHATLGGYCRVRADGVGSPEHRTGADPQRIYQADQLPGAE